MTKKFGLSLASAAVFTLILAGCNGDNDGNNGGPSPAQTATPGTSTTATPSGTPAANTQVFIQQDRLARPLTNEVLATISNNRHKTNNRIAPTQDKAEIGRDVFSFFKFPAGRSDAIANVAVAVLAPDVMMADLSQSGPAAFLGVETGGATGGKFGGRKLQDDVVDIDLGVIFGNTIPALGLAPDDGKAAGLTAFQSDNVGFQGNNLSTFPYIGNPV